METLSSISVGGRYCLLFLGLGQSSFIELPTADNGWTLLFHLVSSLGEFYSDNLSKETNKGKLERSLQGYHNGAVPWGYVSVMQGNRKMGILDLEKAPIAREMFVRYATGKYSDMQMTDWFNAHGFLTSRGNPFSKDTIRDMLCNSYYAGLIRYRGMSVRPKGVSFRSTPPKVVKGQHEGLISEELWQQCQAVRHARRAQVDTQQKTVRVNLLQGLVVCARCGRKLRIQTPSRGPTYYREDSHLRGYKDCYVISQCVQAEVIDSQVGKLIQSLKLPPNWEDSVRKLCQQDRNGPDPETERKEIRTTLRLMRENYERGLYEGEEYQYWQKVSSLKEKLALLTKIPQPAIERAARTLLDLRQSWDWATKEERKELAYIVIQAVGVDVAARHVLWLKVSPGFDVLFQLLENLKADEQRRFWIVYPEAIENRIGIEEDKGQGGIGVKAFSGMSHNVLTRVEEHVQ